MYSTLGFDRKADLDLELPVNPGEGLGTVELGFGDDEEEFVLEILEGAGFLISSAYFEIGTSLEVGLAFTTGFFFGVGLTFTTGSYFSLIGFEFEGRSVALCGPEFFTKFTFLTTVLDGLPSLETFSWSLVTASPRVLQFSFVSSFIPPMFVS